MSEFLIIEIASVILNLLFLALLIKQSKWCWPFGILGSALGVYLFVAPGADVKLYSEAILYSYYVWIGIYGWLEWNKQSNETPIMRWSAKDNGIAVLIGVLVFPALGFVMDTYFESNSPYLDAMTTTFSFIASYMQAKRVFTSWHFWIAINAVTTFLYFSRELYVYTGLMLVYFTFSIYGLYAWRMSLKAES